jgi:hypothetical protein
VYSFDPAQAGLMILNAQECIFVGCEVIFNMSRFDEAGLAPVAADPLAPETGGGAIAVFRARILLNSTVITNCSAWRFFTSAHARNTSDSNLVPSTHSKHPPDLDRPPPCTQPVEAKISATWAAEQCVSQVVVTVASTAPPLCTVAP